MSMRMYEAEKRLLGGHSVYPGHPITVALMITEMFPDLESADRPTEHVFPAALGSQDIPGAGGNVYAALELLRSLKRGKDFEKGMADAEKQWLSQVEGYRDDRVAEGSRQAEVARGILEGRIQAWLGSARASAEPKS
jgi:hypothetical protein